MALSQSNEQLALQPQIVAYVVGSKSATVGSTTLFPSAPAGVYRCSVSLIVTTGGTSGNLVANIIGTDDLQAETIAVATVANLSSTGQVNGVAILENTAAANISYSVTASGTFGSCVYSIYLILERLF